MSYQKPKSAIKLTVPGGEGLANLVQDTMQKIATVVGATLGPGGCPVLIEHQEPGMAPVVTKDGVTVFQSLGFPGSVEQTILDAARDAAEQTAKTAGDGTTTATIMAQAYVDAMRKFCDENSHISPQYVIRHLQKIMSSYVEPHIKSLAISTSLKGEGRLRTASVATVSANGDSELADAVMSCYDICGDYGHVTISDRYGQYGYQVEKIKGYPLEVGYESCCSYFYPSFLCGQSRIEIKEPIFLCHFGSIKDHVILDAVLNQMIQRGLKDRDLVVFATEFSEDIVGGLAQHWTEMSGKDGSNSGLRIFPVKVPRNGLKNSQKDILDDIAAVCDTEVFSPGVNPIDLKNLEEKFDSLGNLYLTDEGYVSGGVTGVVIKKASMIIDGYSAAEGPTERAAEVEKLFNTAESKYEKTIAQERFAKLVGGIAKLTIVGASASEMRERKDRAEDAIMAVKGALREGALVGGCWALMDLVRNMKEEFESDQMVQEILIPAFQAPFQRLLKNIGVMSDEYEQLLASVLDSKTAEYKIVDARTVELTDGLREGILDSLPAVLEATKNAFSIAATLGRLGGAVVFQRDFELDRKEALATTEFNRYANMDPNDEFGR